MDNHIHTPFPAAHAHVLLQLSYMTNIFSYIVHIYLRPNPPKIHTWEANIILHVTDVFGHNQRIKHKRNTLTSRPSCWLLLVASPLSIDATQYQASM